MVGLFFGSFDPVHWGHLIIADIVRREKNFKEIVFIPSPLSPFKIKSSHDKSPQQILKSFHARVEMLKLALTGWEGFSVSDIEKTLLLPSFTYQTLKKLKRQRFYQPSTLIMGKDNFALLPKWKESKWIQKHFPIYVYDRSSNLPNSLDFSTPPAPPLIPSSPSKTPILPLLDFSSYEIRSRIRGRQPICHLVPQAVRLYIEANPSLYKK